MRALIFFLACSLLPAQQNRPYQPLDAANLPAQTIGANDLIAISVYDAPELTRTIRVGADGMIRLPMLKQKVKAEGLMPAELETAIAQALSAEQLFVDPAITVTIAEYHSPPHLRRRRRRTPRHLPGRRPRHPPRRHHSRPGTLQRGRPRNPLEPRPESR